MVWVDDRHPIPEEVHATCAVPHNVTPDVTKKAFLGTVTKVPIDLAGISSPLSIEIDRRMVRGQHWSGR
eukprot:4092785-Amphidinium_carterae.1